jgi:uncharacterized membrane protein
MGLLLAASYVLHVASALFWIGAVWFAAYAVFPPARAGEVDAGLFESTLDRLLWVTRWTGVALPVTGLYQLWLRYPLDRLVATTRGLLVLSMLVLWTVMNGLVELGVYRARTVDSELDLGTYFAEGVAADGGLPSGTVVAGARATRPYVLAASALGVLLAVDAALLAGGVPAVLRP